MKKSTTLSLLNSAKEIYYTALVLFIFLLSFKANAQTLVGMTQMGGDSGGGTLFGYDVPSHRDSIYYHFPLGAEYPRYGSLIQANDGNMYGMTSMGGTANLGTLFSYNSTTNIFTILINFNDSNGANPFGSLIQALDGNLYGMTSMGGSSNNGTIFKYNTFTGQFTTLINFSNNEYPTGSLIQAFDSNLYGMTNGKTYNSGTIFKYNISSGIITTLANLGGSRGGNPYGSLIQGIDSNFYGMTYNGGASNYGTIFKCTPSGTFTTLVNFTGTNGQNPYGSLLQASDSNLYGMTSRGGTGSDGVIFKYKISTATYTVLTNFNLFEEPYGSLMQANDGNLYGMTYMGGSLSNGTVFKCTTSGTFTTVHQFYLYGARYPQGSLIQGWDGNLYGLSYQSDRTGLGTIFSCTPAGAYTTLYYMGVTNIGSTPYASVIQATDGNLYGMTLDGGQESDGTVFKFNTTTGVIKTIAYFNDTIGIHPYGSLMQAADGNLYGMTYETGTSNDGTIFKCTTSGTITPIYDFSGSPDGALPTANLIQATDGNFYGMTWYGGSYNNGTLFQCTPYGSLTTLVKYSNGEQPEGSLIQAIDGKFYGMTYGGGTSKLGTIFSYKPYGAYTVLVNFTGTNGEYPLGSVIQGKDSCLYGMTYKGGAYGYGTIFKCTTTGTFTTLFSFSDTNGAYPYGSLMQASDGNLYGMTQQGGHLEQGTLFQCSTSGKFTTLLKFNKATGTNPYWGSLLELKKTYTSVNNVSTGNNISVYPNPATTELNLTFSKTTTPTPAEIKILDVTGKELITTHAIMNNGTALPLAVSSLAPGIYFVEVITGKETEVAKFIKQ